MTGVAEQYLATAERDGILHHIGGSVFVAGSYRDEISGRHQGLIEFCDPAILSDPDAAEALFQRMTADHPGISVVLVRAQPADEMLPPWRRHLTYVRNETDGPTPVTTAPGLFVAMSSEADDRFVTEMLVRAFRAAGAEQGQGSADPVLRETATRIMGRPDRRSLIAYAAGRPAGHATLLCDSQDDVTGLAFIELLDVLVDIDGPARRAAATALTEAAICYAGQARRPLMGHVVHPWGVGAEKGDGIVSALVAKGWRVDHVYWYRVVPGA